MSSIHVRLLGSLVATALLLAAPAHATTGTPVTTPRGYCDVSPGDYTAWTGTDPAALETASTSTAGVSEARCFKDIRSLGGFVDEGLFKDSKGRFAHELTTFGKLVNMWPGEPGNSICNGEFPIGKKNVPGSYCVGTTSTAKTFASVAAQVNALDWKYADAVRYSGITRKLCPEKWPPMGCFAGRCYDPGCVEADGTLKACGTGQICKDGACVTGSPTSLPDCSTLANLSSFAVTDGQQTYYDPWNGLVFDMGGLANKVAVFAVNDHGPQPCESIEYTVFLTNNPASRDTVQDPAASGPDPSKWNRAKLFRIYTHGWIDNPDCCANPKDCDPTKCTLPKPGDGPVLEGDSMTLLYSLPCGVSFRYASVVAGYDGRSLDDPTKGQDRCAYHSYDVEVDAVAGLTEDETAICPDKDGDGFPSCDCMPKPDKCDCVDDPAVNPDAKLYHPGAPQGCDGPQYSCAPTPCPTGTACVKSQCLRPCEAGEFKCGGGYECQTITADAGPGGKYCVPAPCGDAGICPVGYTCKDGACVDFCATAKCPPGQLCSNGICRDPCAGVACPGGEVCTAGKCGYPCTCLKETALGYPCMEPIPKCEKKTSTCVARGCETLKCPTGKVCVGTSGGPACKGTCEDVICPGKQVCDPVKGCVEKCDLLTTPCPTGTVCSEGMCVEPLCAGVTCTSPFVCREGKCVEADASVSFDTSPPEDAPVVTEDATVDTRPPPSGASPDSNKSGCQCSAPGVSTTGPLALLAIAITSATGAIRRLTRSRRGRRVD